MASQFTHTWHLLSSHRAHGAVCWCLALCVDTVGSGRGGRATSELREVESPPHSHQLMAENRPTGCKHALSASGWVSEAESLPVLWRETRGCPKCRVTPVPTAEEPRGPSAAAEWAAGED